MDNHALWITNKMSKMCLNFHSTPSSRVWHTSSRDQPDTGGKTYGGTYSTSTCSLTICKQYHKLRPACYPLLSTALVSQSVSRRAAAHWNNDDGGGERKSSSQECGRVVGTNLMTWFTFIWLPWHAAKSVNHMARLRITLESVCVVGGVGGCGDCPISWHLTKTQFESPCHGGNLWKLT